MSHCSSPPTRRFPTFISQDAGRAELDGRADPTERHLGRLVHLPNGSKVSRFEQTKASIVFGNVDALEIMNRLPRGGQTARGFMKQSLHLGQKIFGQAGERPIHEVHGQPSARPLFDSLHRDPPTSIARPQPDAPTRLPSMDDASGGDASRHREKYGSGYRNPGNASDRQPAARVLDLPA
jgi:hypothetical protein